MTPNTGPFDIEVTSDAVAALFQKIGPGILVTHSQGGGPGWRTAIKSQNVRAIVAYEPGSNFMFPEGEVPPPMPSAGGTLEAVGVPLSEFMRLTKMPIIIFYGDYIPEKPMANPGQDQWRVRLESGEAVGGCREPQRRRRHRRPSASGRHPREHSLPLLGSQQFGSSGPPIPIPGQEGLGLTCGGNSRSGQLEQTSSARVARRLWDTGPIHGPSLLSDDVQLLVCRIVARKADGLLFGQISPFGSSLPIPCSMQPPRTRHSIPTAAQRSAAPGCGESGYGIRNHLCGVPAAACARPH